MFFQLVLQFSALCLCFSQLGERKQKKGKNGFPVGEPAAVPVPALAGTSPAVMCNKKLF
jgi:hypothetical protein